MTHDYSLTIGLAAIGNSPGTDTAFVKSIKVGNNVFIGMSAILLPGTNIGNNVVIGAGSVVRGKIPDDSIVYGNPAQITGKLSQKALQWEKQLNKQDLMID